MKLRKTLLSSATALTIIPIMSSCLTSCSHRSYKVDPPTDTGDIKQTSYKKVFIISGQSNAAGVSQTEYLQKNITPEEYQKFSDGINTVKISSTIAATFSDVKFVPTTCFTGHQGKCFGIELGFADVMSKKSTQETYIIKFALGGTTLDDQWLDGNGNRGTYYNCFVNFIKQSMSLLTNAKICGMCWMQGENDGELKKHKKYLNNTEKFVSYLREDLKDNTVESGFTFIDAGIATNWKNYDAVNYAKIKYWKSSKLNGYFSTSENNLTNDKEPEGNPDRAHYDSLSELQLGRWFAYKTIELFNNNN